MNHELNGREPRIALLIDADNVPADKIDAITTELSTMGVLNIRRAYGNWTKPGLRGWQEKLHSHAIRPIQQFDNSKGKNATDMAMTVDAMELFYLERPDAFGIVSSDADFTPLVMHLRSKGAAVYGFGAGQTPKPFVSACSRFLYLEALAIAPLSGLPDPQVEAIPAKRSVAVVETEVAEQAGSTTAVEIPGVPERPSTLRATRDELRRDAPLVQLLRAAIKATKDESGWSRVGAIGQQIGNQSAFDPRNYGYATLTKLLRALELFELKDEGTSQVAVRHPRPAPGTQRTAA